MHRKTSNHDSIEYVVDFDRGFDLWHKRWNTFAGNAEDPFYSLRFFYGPWEFSTFSKKK